jgi:hypothetical protein
VGPAKAHPTIHLHTGRAQEEEMATGESLAAQTQAERYYSEGPSTGWTGWIGFAGMMLILIGCFHAIAGFVGLFKDDYYVVSKQNLLISVDYTAWGWIHIAFGLIAVAVGIGMLAGQMWARIVGVIFAIVSALANLAFLSAYPVWSVMVIAFDIIVIWALTVHGGEMKEYP